MTFLLRFFALVCTLAWTPYLHAETPPPPPDILDLASGAVVLSFTGQYNTQDWSSLSLIDGTIKTGWATVKGDKVRPQVFVIELAGPHRLDSFTIDNTGGDEPTHPGVSSRKFTLSASTKSPEGPFSPILNDEAEQNARKTFPLSGEEAMWLKLEVFSNWGDPSYIEIMELEATGSPFGDIPAQTSIAGVYDTNYNLMLFKQKGTRVFGCYDYDGGTVAGSVEGRATKFEWREYGPQIGTAIMVLAADGKTLNGLWYEDGVLQGIWQGTRAALGARPKCTVPVDDNLARNLKDGGRAVVYGIRFDLASDKLRPESNAILEEILQTLTTDNTMKLVIEGHTDSTGGANYNTELSQRRAASVVAWLEKRGIVTGRLNPDGRGESTPIADNETPQGRMLNRRVELRVIP